VFASNFGNLGIFVIFGPILLIGLFAGAIFSLRKKWRLVLACGGLCILCSAMFFSSIPNATASDKASTVKTGGFALVVGLSFSALGLLYKGAGRS
jgi:hypothetical protein